MQSEEEQVRQCGFRDGNTHQQCPNEATHKFPIRDASTIPDGTVYLCDYHLGRIIGYVLDRLDSEEERE